MLDLYLSSKTLLESDSYCKAFQELIFGKYISIKAADQKILDIIANPDSKAFNIFMSKDHAISSGVEVCDALNAKASGKKILGWKPTNSSQFSSAAFFMDDISDEISNKLAGNPGILAKNDTQNSVKKIFSDIGKDYIDTIDYPDETNDTIYSWSDVFSNVKGLPFNSIIVNDRYLVTDNPENKPENKLENLSIGLRYVIKSSKCSIPFHVLVLIGLPKEKSKGIDLYDETSLREIAAKYIEHCFIPISYAYSRIRIHIEFIFCDGHNKKLLDITHNRYLITNYSIFKSEFSLPAINGDGSSNGLQTIMSLSSFASDHARKARNIFLKNIKDCLIGKDAKPNFVRCFMVDLFDGEIERDLQIFELHMIQNRLITDLQEGDLCYYLSVKDDNDWIKTKVIGPVNYFAKSFRSCICSKDYSKLDKIAEKIRKEFECIPDEHLAKNVDTPFYRIHVNGASNIRTIDYIESSSQSELENQIKDYKNNYFCNEDFTVELINKICSILSIEPITKHGKETVEDQ